MAVLVAPMITPPTAPASALGHAEALVSIERATGLFHEGRIQAWFLHVPELVIAANWWYGLMHFAVTAAVFIWLFRKHHDSYPLWRNTLATASVLALATQAVWPATPPRLLAGAAETPFFVDTLSHFSALWSFSGGGSGGVANQYAAMPSMHCVWAFWCACVLIPRVRHRWTRIAAAIYPMVTIAAIVVTGNHYLVDAVAGVAALALGYGLARRFTRAGRRVPPVPPASPEEQPGKDPERTLVGSVR